MRASFRTALLATSLLLASCSDDPTTPSGSRVERQYDVSFDFFSASVRSLWGTPNGDMYASGAFILKYDGTEWRPLQLPTYDRGFSATWGTSNGDLYAVGFNNIHRYDGSQWHEIARPASVSDVWGSDDGHIFVVGGGNNRLYHYDGATWTVDSLIVANYEFDPWGRVSGASARDVYIGGTDGWLGHYNGHDWSSMRPDTTRSFSWSLWKAPDGPLYLSSYDSLFTFDGQEIRPVDLGENVWDARVTGRSATEVYCTASGGNIFSYDGINWKHVAEMDDFVDALWGDRASNRLFAAGSGAIWKIEGTTPTLSFGQPDRRGGEFADLWGSEEDGLFVVGSRAYRYLDGTWTDLHKHSLTDYPARSVWGRSGHELYAVGDGMILHYDGDQWTWVSGGAGYRLLAVTGTERDAYAVGSNGTILQLRNGRWTPMESGTSYWLLAVYAWDTQAFAAGEDGAIIHYDGREWRPFPSPVSWDIYDMFGFGNQIYAVGSDQTEICQFNGKSWNPIFVEYSGGVNVSIWGTSQRNLFIGKSDGNVIHFDGSEWSFLPRVTSASVNSLWGAPDGTIITANSRVVVRYTR